MANLAKKFVGIGDRVSDVFSLTCLRATRQTKSRAFGADEDEKKSFLSIVLNVERRLRRRR